MKFLRRDIVIPLAFTMVAACCIAPAQADIVSAGRFLSATATTNGSGPTDTYSQPGNPPGSMAFVTAGTYSFPEGVQGQASLNVGLNLNSPEGSLGSYAVASGATGEQLIATSLAQQTTQWQANSANGSPIGIDIGLVMDGYLRSIVSGPGANNLYAAVGLQIELGLANSNTVVYDSTARLDTTSGLTGQSVYAQWLNSFTDDGTGRRFDMDYQHQIDELFFVEDGAEFSITATLSTEAFVNAFELTAESNFLNTLTYSVTTSTPGATITAGNGVPEPTSVVLLMGLMGGVLLQRRRVG